MFMYVAGISFQQFESDLVIIKQAIETPTQ